MTCRTVQLRHELPDGSWHIDWMLDLDAGGAGRLMTLRLVARVDDLAVGDRLEAQRIADHRRSYLDYEGPISGERGQVIRVANGYIAALDSVADHWHLVQLLLRVAPTLEAAVKSLELSQIAKHAHQLAQSFNSFYHRFPVLKEEDPVIRTTRVALVRLFHDGMVDLLGLMGIAVPDRM